VRRVLARLVADLVPGQLLPLAELTADAATRWEVTRDSDGVARAGSWEPVPWEQAQQHLERVVNPEGHPGLTLVSVAPSTRAPLRSTEPLADALAAVLAADPLTVSYELAVLRETPAGWLEPATVPLFWPGNSSGERTPLSIRIERSDEGGTAFVVLARDGDAVYTRVCQQSAVIRPGIYQVTAELVRPGKVRFTGLPAALSADRRDWNNLTAAIPPRLGRAAPAHLVIAVESSGPPEQVRERFGRAEQLVRAIVGQQSAGQPGGKALFSLVIYGPHRVHVSDPETPVRWIEWAASGAKALEQVRRLADRPADPVGYPRAAQIECMLAAVNERLGRPAVDEIRPVLVTIGARPAFPDRGNLSRIIPCRTTKWEAELYRLHQHYDIAFGAIRDRREESGDAAPGEDAWHGIGADAFAWLDEVDVRRFAQDLRLLPPPNPPVPLPLDPGAPGPAAGA
jgi:ribosomal protein S16